MELHAQAEAAELLQPGRTSGQSAMFTRSGPSATSAPHRDLMASHGRFYHLDQRASAPISCLQWTNQMKERSIDSRRTKVEIQEKRGERVHAGSALEDGRSLRVNEEKEL